MRDSRDTSLCPRGEYWRNAPNRISESKLGSFATACFGKALEEELEGLVRKNLRAVVHHLERPRESWILRQGFHEEQGLPRRRASQPWLRVPLPSPASTTTVASEISAIVRFRIGKHLRPPEDPGGNCETARCSRMMSS